MQYNQTQRSQPSKSMIKSDSRPEENDKYMLFSIFSFSKLVVYSIVYIFLSYSANEWTTLAWNNQNIKVYP